MEDLCLDCSPVFANAAADVQGGCIIGLCCEKPCTAKFEENVLCVCVCVFGRLRGAVNLFL